jgi:ABC-type cobalamin transport system ATPase subunit
MALLAGGEIATAGKPAEVLSSEACGRAFGVDIRAHGAGLSHPLYSFEEVSK